MTAGVALVGIGQGIAESIGAESGQGIDARVAAAFLEWCAVTVAIIQAAIMTLRIFHSDAGMFKILFTFGMPPATIAVIRGVELLLGLTATVAVGLAIAVLALLFLFQIPGSHIRPALFAWAAAVGFFPMLLLPVVVSLSRTSHD